MKTDFNKQDFVDWLSNECDYYKDKADDSEESFEERKFAKNVLYGINKVLGLIAKGRF
jgi:hypothetical protein